MDKIRFAVSENWDSNNSIEIEEVREDYKPSSFEVIIEKITTDQGLVTFQDVDKGLLLNAVDAIVLFCKVRALDRTPVTVVEHGQFAGPDLGDEITQGDAEKGDHFREKVSYFKDLHHYYNHNSRRFVNVFLGKSYLDFLLKGFVEDPAKEWSSRDNDNDNNDDDSDQD